MNSFGFGFLTGLKGLERVAWFDCVRFDVDCVGDFQAAFELAQLAPDCRDDHEIIARRILER
jgi:hypothetical protein